PPGMRGFAQTRIVRQKSPGTAVHAVVSMKPGVGTRLYHSEHLREPCRRNHEVEPSAYFAQVPHMPDNPHDSPDWNHTDRKSTRLNSSHVKSSSALFCP